MTLDLGDPTAVLLATSDALTRAGLDVAAYGGLALAAYGAARETRDADLAVVSVSGPRAEAALRAAGLDAVVTFDRVRFGGNFVTRLTLLPGVGASGLNTADLVEPLSPRYASGVLSRSYQGSLRGAGLRIVSPEDFVIMKVLSTRDRDVEDATTVMKSLTGRIDQAAIEREAALLAREITDHDVAGRLRRVLTSSG